MKTSIIKILCFGIITQFFLVTGCSDSVDPVQAPLDRNGLIVETYSQRLTQTYFQSLVNNTDQLDQKAKSICSETSTGVTLDKLRGQWANAMVDYHRLKVLLYAPESSVAEFSESPLRFIYSPYPSKRAENFINRQIKKAGEDKELFTMKRLLSHSTGFNALENLLFNIFADREGLESDSGDCYFLKYTTSTLKDRVAGLFSQWNQSELASIKSAAGAVGVNDTLKQMSAHVVAFTDRVFKDQSILAPMGLKQEIHPCDDQPCVSKYLEHPFYPDRKISIVAPLEVLSKLFIAGSSSEKAFANLYTFEEYIGKSDIFEKSSGGLNKALNLAKNLPEGDLFPTAFDNEAGTANSGLEILRNLEAFTDWLKVDFLLELNTELPKSYQGDSD